MTVKKPATRNGVSGHIVVVQRSERFVPHEYRGTDPRTVAKKRK